MKTKYCWRCKIDVPMLDEEEFEAIERLYGECMKATKEFRLAHNVPLQEASISERFKPVRDAYKRLTGFDEENENAIMHHRLSQLGPDCPSCGRPLRSQNAKMCPECGWQQ